MLLYLDEIQYFNKKQQQTLLEYIENGKITLIASTTENPYFYVYNAILSRSTVFEFKPVEKDEAQRAVSRALNYLESRDSVTILPEPGVKEHIAPTPTARRSTPSNFFTRPHGPKTAWSGSPWQTQSRCHSARPCAMINPATIIMTIFPRS